MKLANEYYACVSSFVIVKTRLPCALDLCHSNSVSYQFEQIYYVYLLETSVSFLLLRTL